MDFLITFLEGVVTFVSPCLLPMLPIYVAYFAGDVRGGESGGGLGPDDGRGGRLSGGSGMRRTVCSVFGFIVGFSLLFCLMGAFAGAFGSLLLRHQALLDAGCGAIVVALGLNYLGVLRLPVFQRAFKRDVGIVPRGFVSSLLFGAVFAVGWTPCVGAFLGSALSLAASSGHAAKGLMLLLSYSLGLGVPFFIAALLIDRLEGALSWVKRHYGVVDKACGTLLVVVGVLMATGTLGLWMRVLAA